MKLPLRKDRGLLGHSLGHGKGCQEQGGEQNRGPKVEHAPLAPMQGRSDMQKKRPRWDSNHE